MISVVVRTYNRCESLRKTLKALSAYALGRRRNAMYRTIDFWIQLGQIAGIRQAARLSTNGAGHG